MRAAKECLPLTKAGSAIEVARVHVEQRSRSSIRTPSTTGLCLAVGGRSPISFGKEAHDWILPGEQLGSEVAGGDEKG